MAIKIISDTREELPENVRDSAKEVDGKFELDGGGVIAKNKELLGKNSTLRDKVTELEASVDEYKGKAKIPADKELVDKDIAELGTAAKEAGLVKDEMPTLKTAAADKQAIIDSMNNKRLGDEVADALKWNRDGFRKLAKGLNIVGEDVKEGEKTNKKYFVVSKDAEGKEVKTEVAEDANFKPFISALAEKPRQGFNHNDPPPAGGITDTDQDKAAANSMAQSVRSTF